MVEFFGDSQDNFTEIARAAESHSDTAGLWVDILTSYFRASQKFKVQPEERLADGKKSDLIVIHGADKSSTVIIVECKPKNSSETWDNARKQCFDYIRESLKKKKNPTIGVIAKGDKFILFKVPGTQMGDSHEYIQVGMTPAGVKIAKGSPSDVVDQAAALEDELKKIKADALNNVYKNE